MRIVPYHRIFLVLTFGLLIFPLSVVNAQETPTEAVTGTIERLQKTLEDTGLTSEKRSEIVNGIVFERFDLERLTDLILKPYKGKDKEENLEAFRTLYREYMKVVQLGRVEKLRGTKIAVIDEVRSGEGQATITAKIYFKDGDDMTVSFFLNYIGGTWRVFDIDFGITTFAQFEYASFGKRTLPKKGMLGMFEEMREKMRELKQQRVK